MAVPDMQQIQTQILLVFLKIFKLFFKNLEIPPIPSACAIIKKQGKILMVKSPKGIINFPGGVMMPLETPSMTAIRETEEETGLKIKIIKPLGVYPWKYSFAGLVFSFEAKILKGKLRSSKEGKPVWLKPEIALKKLPTELKKNILKDYLNQ